MAINKNFVIKNGLEVNTNVLVAASEESQVGVGTTRPYYKLHVGGGEGNRGGIGATDITITGIATIGVANSDAGAFNVLGISTFKGDIDLIGSAGVSTVRWDASKDGLIFQDNATARFGTGEDLRIWHDGSNSYISDQGTGSLIIYGTDETLAVFTDDGSVQLYNNDSKKLETTGLGITVYGDNIVSGVTTTARLKVTGISTFTGNIDANGNLDVAGTSAFNDDVTLVAAGSSTILFDASAHKIVLQDNIKAKFGTGEDLAIWHNGSNSFIENSTGNISFHSNEVVFRNGNSSKIIGNFSADGVNLFDNNTERLSTTAIGATVFGDFIASGVGTFGSAYVTGIATFASDVNVQGNLNVTGDITYDEITGRNLNITGITTLADQVNFGTSGIGATIYKNGNMTVSGIVTVGGNLNVTGSTSLTSLDVSAGLGIAESLFHLDDTNTRVAFPANDTITFDTGGSERFRIRDDGNVVVASNIAVTGIATAGILSVTENARIAGIVTADRFVGIHTSADGGGVGIGSTTAHVGYGITYIDFKGPGVSTVYYSSVTGVSTVYFQGGGGSSVGAAGTWQNDGTPGISTAKSVGINTNSINDGDLQGRPYVGAAGSFQGLYIGNGMVVNDNQLNGNHYIGTAFGGIMAGPVTVNGVVTVDGNWAVV